MNKAHQNETKNFEELEYAEQAKSINAQLLNLERAILANARRAKAENRDNPLTTRITNVEDMVLRLKDLL